MSKNNGKTGVCDPASIILLMQKASWNAGHASSPQAKALQNEPVLTIYEKNGKYHPVTTIIDNTMPNLELSRNHDRTIENMANARKYMEVPLKAFMEVWDKKDDFSLGNKDEAREKLAMITEVFTEGPIDGAMNMGVKVFNAIGTEVKRPEKRMDSAPRLQYV